MPSSQDVMGLYQIQRRATKMWEGEERKESLKGEHYKKDFKIKNLILKLNVELLFTESCNNKR